MRNHLLRYNTIFRLSGLLFLSLLLGGRVSAQALICNDFIQTSLDFECKDTVKADEVLEGSYCCYDNYLVEIDKSPGGTDCDGIWDFNVVYGSDIGMTYCVRVSDPFTGSVCYSYVYIVDNTAPSITCPASQARNTDPGLCKYATLGAEFDPASFQDNCPDNLSTSYMLSGSTTGSGPSTLNGLLMNSGITTIKWKVTDPVGNSATCTFSVTVSDMEPPAITCPADQPRNTDPGQCDYTTVAGEFDPLAFGDNCGGTSLNYSLTGAVNWNGPASLSGFLFPPGQTTVTWVVGDGSNLDATCSFLVTISAQAPTVTCPGPQSRNTKPNQCHYTTLGSEFDPLVGNGCGSTSLAFNLSGATTGNGATTLASTAFQKGQTTVVWTATDAAGNPATCSFIVTVIDNQGPGIGCVVAQNRNTNTGVCNYTAVGTEFNPTFVNDNCAGASIAYILAGATTGSGANTLAGQIFQKGQTTVTWTVTDVANLTKTCSFTVTVSDAQQPSITCPGPQSRNTNTGVCTYTTVGAEFNPLAFSDNCPGAGITYILSGVTTGSGTGTLAGVVLNKGVTMVSWTVTDAVNQTAVCAFNVTVNDGQAPTITCPGPQTRKTDSNLCTYTTVGTEFNPSAAPTDNCPGAIQISYTLAGVTTGTGASSLAGKVFNKGQTTVTWTAIDAASNTGTCSFIVIINDLQNPTITCPGNQIRNTNNGVCTYTAVGAELDPLAAGDNCPGPISFGYALNGATTGTGTGTLAGKVFNKGQTFIAWSAIDASGNPWTCNFVLVVTDAQSPFFICPINQIRYVNAGLCTYTIAGVEIDPVAITDNCPGVNLSFVYSGATTGSGTTTLGGSVLNKGVTTITWTATDASNNTASCSFTVDVKDGQGPGINCPSNQTRSTNPNLCSYTAVGAEFNLIAAGDNCPGAVGFTYTLTGVTTGSGTATLSGKVFNKGVTTVKWTATDISNNTSVCTFTVDVKDNEPPKFTSCPPVALYNVNMTPGCTITIPNLASLANANATDNCPGLTKTQSPAAGTVMTVTHNQSISVVITAKDAAGNMATCNRIVKAKDVTTPTITTCPPNRTVSLSPDCKITVPDMRTQLVATDCSGPLTVTQNPAQGTVLPSDAGDVFNVTMIVKDVAGNIKTCTVVLTAEYRYFAYVANHNSHDVSVINTTTNTVVATVPLGNIMNPQGVSVSPDGNRVYISNDVGNNSTNGYVSVVNTSSNTTSTPIGVGAYPLGICASPDGSLLYVVNYNNSFVYVVSTTSNQIIASINVGQYCKYVCVSPDGSRVYVTGPNHLYVIDAATNQVIPSATVQICGPYGVCVSPDGSKIYVASPCLSKVVVVSSNTSSIIAQIVIGPYARGICVSPDGSRVYVTTQSINGSNGAVSVINTVTNQVIATVGVGSGNTGPAGISITPDGAQVYVVNSVSNNVAIINTATNTLVTSVGVGSNPISMGNFIGGPLCLFGNNLVANDPETSYADPETVAHRGLPASSDLRAMPNPFTDELSIAFDLETPSRAQVVLADLTGRFVFFEKDNWLDAGAQSLVWNTEDLPEGAYLIGLKVEGKAWIYRKVMLIR